jgi:phosphoglycolate phosphatase-like HAD superfamily hydrolase
MKEELYYMIIESLGLSPSETLAVGDSIIDYRVAENKKIIFVETLTNYNKKKFEEVSIKPIITDISAVYQIASEDLD